MLKKKTETLPADLERNTKIKRINRLLINKFGIPKKNSEPPDALDLIIATILSQNTNDKNSYRAYLNLKKKFKDWEKTRKASIESIESAIQIAGLGKQKSLAIKNLLNILFENNKKLSLDHLKKLNDERVIEELVKFKGVGVKTASCVLLFSWSRNICPVDTHVHRICNRIGIVKEKTPDKTFISLNNKFPPKIAHSFHTNLIRLGREICKAKTINCKVCPIISQCDFESKNPDEQISKTKGEFMLLDNITV